MKMSHFIEVFVLMSNPIFHFSLRCLGRNSNFRLNVAKKLLSVYHSNLIWFQRGTCHRGHFFIDFMTSFVDIVLLVAQEWNRSESIFLLKRYYFLENKRVHKFMSQLFNFPNFHPDQLFSSWLHFASRLFLKKQYVLSRKLPYAFMTKFIYSILRF